MVLVQFNNINKALEEALNKSILSLNNNNYTAHIWEETVLKNNLEFALREYANNNNQSNCCYPNPRSQNGFRITFGIQINLDYKIGFRTNLNIGYGIRKNNLAGSTSVHFNLYNNGLGTPVNNSDSINYDVTVAANIIIGIGENIPLQSYSLNYLTPIPFLNDFNKSISYGQLFTWNSGINSNQLSLDTIQRQGMIGLRIGQVNISTNNDTKMGYFGEGTDHGWTGGFSLSTPYFEVGFQDFSGNFIKDYNYYKRESLKNEIKKVEKDKSLSKEEKNELIESLKTELKILLQNNPYHPQDSFNIKFNKASTYLRFINKGNQIDLEYIGEAWLQNAIHNLIKDYKFRYDNKKTSLWQGSTLSAH